MKKILLAMASGALLISATSLPINAAGLGDTKASLKITYNEKNVPTDVDLRFGGIISDADYNEASEYGVLVVDNLAKLENVDLAKMNEFKNNGFALKINPAKVDGGYQLAWVIDNVEGHYGDSLTAAVYEINGDVVTLAKEKTASVKEVATAYKAMTDNPAITADVEKVLDVALADADVEKSLSWNGTRGQLEGWALNGKCDAGVGEGMDLHVDGNNGWSAVERTMRIPASMPELQFTARVFRRGGEIYPDIQLRVNGQAINAIGFSKDTVHIEHDQSQSFRYDLSAFANQEVKLELGIIRGTHCPISNVMFKTPTKGILFGNRTEILENFNNGGYDPNPGEGVDLFGAKDKFVETKNKLMITSELDTLTFGSRVFHRANEQYPHYKVLVNGKLIRAIGATEDTVYVDTDAIKHFSYDLKEFIGQEVSIKIVVDGPCTHAVLTDIYLK